MNRDGPKESCRKHLAQEEDTPLARPSVPAMNDILGKRFPVLDHGFVRVIDYMGDDPAVVQAARVSYGSGTKLSLIHI